MAKLLILKIVSRVT